MFPGERGPILTPFPKPKKKSLWQRIPTSLDEARADLTSGIRQQSKRAQYAIEKKVAKTKRQLKAQAFDVLGIEETPVIRPDQLGGRPVRVTKVDGGLLGGFLGALGANGVALGGFAGALLRSDAGPDDFVHKLTHMEGIYEQGMLSWHAAYQARYWMDTIGYGSRRTAYEYHPKERIALEKAEQDLPDIAKRPLKWWELGEKIIRTEAEKVVDQSFGALDEILGGFETATQDIVEDTIQQIIEGVAVELNQEQ